MAPLSNTIGILMAQLSGLRLIALLRGLVGLGTLALLYYLSWWWLAPGRIFSPWLALALALAAIYDWAQLLGSWLLYLNARQRPAAPPTTGDLSVDVFVTACKEPYELVERSLAAACGMRRAHCTWLLDDGGDPALAALAGRLGAGYLTRPERADAKAGNVNAALEQTQGEIVVIFDIDHAPQADFLERTLGYFADPRVGFVQAMLTFGNQEASWVARAAAESSLDFYNPTCMGADGVGAATLIGSNALIRREALEGIGGYRPGLAEDLATSVALHAAGWRSVYVAEPLAPGLAPVDVPGWFNQQLKWARGVFEVVLADYPRLFPRLNWGQRLSYSVRGSYYWIGLVIAVHMSFTIAMLFGGSRVAQVDFHQYLMHIYPLVSLAILIRLTALYTWRHPSTPVTPLWRAMVLVYATWPVYALAWALAVLRVPMDYRPTPKKPGGALNPLWLLPQGLALVLLVGGAAYSLLWNVEPRPATLLGFTVIQGSPLALFLWQGLRESFFLNKGDVQAKEPNRETAEVFPKTAPGELVEQ